MLKQAPRVLPNIIFLSHVMHVKSDSSAQHEKQNIKSIQDILHEPLPVLFGYLLDGIVTKVNPPLNS